MNEIITQDRELFLFLNNLGSSEFDFFWIFVAGKWSWIPLYAILLFILYLKFSLKQLGIILLFVALGVTISDQLAGVFKYGFERLRPCHDMTLTPYMRVVECGGRFGFYSSHASNTFFLACFLGLMIGEKYRYLSPILFFWATLVAYSRIYLGVHFPLDIITGAVIGCLIGIVMAFFTKKIIYK